MYRNIELFSQVCYDSDIKTENKKKTETLIYLFNLLLCNAMSGCRDSHVNPIRLNRSCNFRSL